MPDGILSHDGATSYDAALARTPLITLPVATIVRLHAALIVVLVLAHIATQSVKFLGGRDFVFGLIPMFDMDAEGNVPASCQGVILLIAAMLLFYIAWHERHRASPLAKRWLLLGAAFAYLAVDELGKVHEMVDFIGSGGANADVPYWIIPLGLFAAAVGLYMVPLLRRVPRAIAVGLVISGAVYVFGAAGMEFLSQKPVALVDFGTYPYSFEVALEEGTEMLGILLFIRTLLLYIARQGYRAAVAVRA